MRAARSSDRRLLVFILVAGAHTCLVLILAHRQLNKSRHPEAEDISMAMILFPAARRPTADRVPPARRPVVQRLRLPQQVAAPVPEVPPPPSAATSGSAIDWDLERERAAQAMVEPSATRAFGSHPEAQVVAPRPNQPLHQAGESYVDTYGDRIVWLTANCYLVSEAPELGVPETFKHVKPTRGGCLRQGPGEGELFKDLPEYKKRHPQ